MNADMHFMRHALSLAGRNLGQTWPNPAVGALTVRDGIVLGAGWTSRGGRPHAEPQALAQAGGDARGATLYVTLEPCPNCAQTIIDAGVSTVFMACRDPNLAVDGKGIAALRAAGIEVAEGLCAPEAERLNAGFFSVVRRGRPYVGLKIATSSDGKISGGKNKWITGESARDYGHLLRSQYDAILTGIGTVRADDPRLTCRLPGLEDRSPQRIVMDRHGRLPDSANILPAWVITPSPLAGEGWGGGTITISPPPNLPPQGGEELKWALAALAAKGVTRLLVEGGAAITTAFLQENLADRLYWFRAPAVIGKDGLGIAAELLSNPRFRLLESLRLGDDVLEVYACGTSPICHPGHR